MKMDDRRLPRPIGGERTWKGSGTGSSGHGGGGVGGNMPFSGMDGLEQAPPPSNWLSGMYGSNQGPQPQQGFPGSGGNQGQGLPHPQQRIGGDRGGNVMGRRYMDEIDANRILELQQVCITDIILSVIDPR